MKRAFMSRPDMPMAERLAARVEVDPETGCHNWTGTTNRRGYGKLWNPRVGQNRLTHRIAYEIAIGPVPAGLVLDHLCRNPRCCNPQHLEPVTVRENTLRGVSPAALAAQRTHCDRGHDLSTGSVRVERSGQRRCLTCAREYMREYRLGVRRRATAYGSEPAQPNGLNQTPDQEVAP